jgi:hypothetical protein
MSEPSVKCSAALFVFRVDYPIGTTERCNLAGNREKKNSQAAERFAAFSF